MELLKKSLDQKKFSLFFLSLIIFWSSTCFAQDIAISDISRLNLVNVQQVVQPRTTQELVRAVLLAKKHHLRISISGKSHSQGGQSYYPNSLHINMLDYNKILSLNEKNKTITVQSGATWKQIQDYINPYNLAIKVMQSSNIFTVGGSLSVNAHGRDLTDSPIISTVQSFRLLLANGNIINVSKKENKQLFDLVIGGYGLFGIILDVTLQLTDNNILKYQSKMIDYNQFEKYFNSKIKGNKNIALFFARLSIAPGKKFLRKMYIVSYLDTHKKPQKIVQLVNMDKKNDLVFSPFFNLSRKSRWGKDVRGGVEQFYYVNLPHNKSVTRNNAMRPPITFLTKYQNKKNTDILQEYFVPTNEFIPFIDGLRKLAKQYHINLLNVTIRYEPKRASSFLSYSTKNSFAIVIYANIPLSKAGKEQAKQWTRDLVNLTLATGGTYYLPYQLWPTYKQLIRAYPMINKFCRYKKIYDPSLIFMNEFYSTYCNHRA